MTADTGPGINRSSVDRVAWAAAVRELVGLRRDEAAAEAAEEDGAAEELRRVFRDRRDPLPPRVPA